MTSNELGGGILHLGGPERPTDLQLHDWDTGTGVSDEQSIINVGRLDLSLRCQIEDYVLSELTNNIQHSLFNALDDTRDAPYPQMNIGALRILTPEHNRELMSDLLLVKDSDGHPSSMASMFLALVGSSKQMEVPHGELTFGEGTRLPNLNEQSDPNRFDPSNTAITRMLRMDVDPGGPYSNYPSNLQTPPKISHRHQINYNLDPTRPVDLDSTSYMGVELASMVSKSQLDCLSPASKTRYQMAIIPLLCLQAWLSCFSWFANNLINDVKRTTDNYNRGTIHGRIGHNLAVAGAFKTLRHTRNHQTGAWSETPLAVAQADVSRKNLTTNIRRTLWCAWFSLVTIVRRVLPPYNPDCRYGAESSVLFRVRSLIMDNPMSKLFATDWTGMVRDWTFMMENIMIVCGGSESIKDPTALTRALVSSPMVNIITSTVDVFENLCQQSLIQWFESSLISIPLSWSKVVCPPLDNTPAIINLNDIDIVGSHSGDLIIGWQQLMGVWKKLLDIAANRFRCNKLTTSPLDIDGNLPQDWAYTAELLAFLLSHKYTIMLQDWQNKEASIRFSNEPASSSMGDLVASSTTKRNRYNLDRTHVKQFQWRTGMGSTELLREEQPQRFETVWDNPAVIQAASSITDESMYDKIMEMYGFVAGQKEIQSLDTSINAINRTISIIKSQGAPYDAPQLGPQLSQNYYQLQQQLLLYSNQQPGETPPVKLLHLEMWDESRMALLSNWTTITAAERESVMNWLDLSLDRLVNQAINILTRSRPLSYKDLDQRFGSNVSMAVAVRRSSGIKDFTSLSHHGGKVIRSTTRNRYHPYKNTIETLSFKPQHQQHPVVTRSTGPMISEYNTLPIMNDDVYGGGYKMDLAASVWDGVLDTATKQQADLETYDGTSRSVTTELNKLPMGTDLPEEATWLNEHPNMFKIVAEVCDQSETFPCESTNLNFEHFQKSWDQLKSSMDGLYQWLREMNAPASLLDSHTVFTLASQFHAPPVWFQKKRYIVVATQNPAAAFASTKEQLESLFVTGAITGATRLFEMIRDHNGTSEVGHKWINKQNDTFEAHYERLKNTSTYLESLVNSINNQSTPFEEAYRTAGTLIRVDPIPLSYDHHEDLWRRYKGQGSAILVKKLTIANPADARPQMFVVDVYTKDPRNKSLNKASLLLQEAKMKVVAHRLMASSFLTCKKSLNWWGNVATTKRDDYTNRIINPDPNNPAQWLNWNDLTIPNPQPSYRVYENYESFWNPSLTDLCGLLHETRP